METTIKHVVKQVKKGNHEAFGFLIEQFEQPIFQHCYRLLGSFHDAEEVAQETFVKAYTNIKTFKQRQNFTPWLYRIATNTAIDWMRKKKPLYVLDQPITAGETATYLDQMMDEKLSTQEIIERQESWDELQHMLMQIPNKYRHALVLKYVDQFSIKEIAAILDLPEGTIKTHIHRGRDAMRKQIDQSKVGGKSSHGL